MLCIVVLNARGCWPKTISGGSEMGQATNVSEHILFEIFTELDVVLVNVEAHVFGHGGFARD